MNDSAVVGPPDPATPCDRNVSSSFLRFHTLPVATRLRPHPGLVTSAPAVSPVYRRSCVGRMGAGPQERQEMRDTAGAGVTRRIYSPCYYR